MEQETVYSSATSLETDSQEGLTDVDSAVIDDSRSIRTQSLTSSVYNYRFENGRRYHAYRDGIYLLPNDELEQDRLDLQHHLFRLGLDGELVIAPIPNDVQNVLDVGCGTGIWAIEFADEHPSAKVLGIDLSPIQPLEVPPNCSFLVDDAEAEWLFDEKFDLIHSRTMVWAYKNWPRFFQQAYDFLNPGGYIELQDFCLPAHCDDPAGRVASRHISWTKNLALAGSKIGVNLQAPLSWEMELKAAGFVDIHLHWYNWPCGTWARGDKNKLLGKWVRIDLLDSVKATGGMFMRVLGWTPDEFEVMCAETRNELLTSTPHVYYTVCFCYARKPECVPLAPTLATSNSVPESEEC